MKYKKIQDTLSNGTKYKGVQLQIEGLPAVMWCAHHENDKLIKVGEKKLHRSRIKMAFKQLRDMVKKGVPKVA